jgi:hypothetical protein
MVPASHSNLRKEGWHTITLILAVEHAILSSKLPHSSETPSASASVVHLARRHVVQKLYKQPVGLIKGFIYQDLHVLNVMRVLL